MTLKKGILWSQRKMRPQKARRMSGKYNPIMAKIMANPKIARALDQPRERKEFWNMVKSVSREGVYKKEMRKLFGDLRSKKIRSRTISKKELLTIAKAIFPDSKRRYIFSGSAATERSGSKYAQVNPTAKNSASESKEIGHQAFFERQKAGGVAAQTGTDFSSGRTQAFPKKKTGSSSTQPSGAPEKKSPSYAPKKPSLRQALETRGRLADAAPKVGLVSDLQKPAEAMAKEKEIVIVEQKTNAAEEKRKEAVKKLHSSQNIDYEFVKTGLVSDIPENKKTENGEAKPGAPLLDDSPASRRKMAAIMNKIRSADDSGDSESGFSGAMAATTRNKK